MSRQLTRVMVVKCPLRGGDEVDQRTKERIKPWRNHIGEGWVGNLCHCLISHFAINNELWNGPNNGWMPNCAKNPNRIKFQNNGIIFTANRPIQNKQGRSSAGMHSIAEKPYSTLQQSVTFLLRRDVCALPDATFNPHKVQSCFMWHFRNMQRR